MRGSGITGSSILLPLLAVCLAAGPAEGQEGQLFVFASETAVHLRWIPAARADIASYRVEASENGGAWQPLGPDALIPSWDVARLKEVLGSQAGTFLRFFFQPPLPEGGEVSREAVRAFEVKGGGDLLTVLTGLDPRLAEALGELYVHRELKPGARVRYRVRYTDLAGESGILAGPSDPIVHGEATDFPAPEGLYGEAGDTLAHLGWTHRPELGLTGQTVAYRVYRQDDPTGAFESASLLPIVPLAMPEVEQPYYFTDYGLENGGPPITVTPQDTTPPLQPTGFELAPTGSAPLLRWAPDPDVHHWELLRGSAPGGPFEPWETAAPLRQPLHLLGELPAGPGWFLLVAVDAAGNRSQPAGPVKVFRLDTQAPPPPQGLTGQTERGALVLQWQPVAADDLAGYLLERSLAPEGPWTQAFVQLIQETRVREPMPEERDTTWHYRVKAIDLAGNESAPSEVIRLQTWDQVPPTPPRLKQLERMAEAVSLTWSAVRSPDLAGYRVERAASKEGPWAALHEGLLPNDQVTWEAPLGDGSKGAWVYFRVVAVDEAGNEAAGPPDTVQRIDLEAPAPPRLEAKLTDEGTVHLRWEPDGSPDIVSYVVYRQPEGEEGFAAMAEVTQPTFTDHWVEPEQRYVYFVVATDGAGNTSKPSNEVEVVRQ